MGKYMKKTKSAVAMELSSTSSSTATVAAESSGVRTRAKTLALQKLQQQRSPSPTKIAIPLADESSLSYLQLRSRRLEKPPLRKEDSDEISGSRRGLMKCKAPSSRLARVSSETVREEGNLFGSSGGGGEDGSFGENYCSDFEARDSRSTRESTPCSLVKRSDDVSDGTPGSTTRQGVVASNRRVSSNETLRNFPTVQEMDDFFARAEERQQRLFIEKYNFDVVNDVPLPGRYEWIQITP